MTQKHFLAAACVLLTSFSLSAQQPKLPESEPIKDAPVALPDFTFYNLDGSAFTQTDVKPKTRTVFILFDVGCGHCQHEMVDIGKRYKDFSNVNFYLVTMDQKQQIAPFMDSFGRYLKDKPNVHILLDPKRAFIPTFHPVRYPGIFVYTSDKKLLFARSGQTPVKDVLKAL